MADASGSSAIEVHPGLLVNATEDVTMPARPLAQVGPRGALLKASGLLPTGSICL